MAKGERNKLMDIQDKLDSIKEDINDLESLTLTFRLSQEVDELKRKINFVIENF